jgi:DNA-binding XRE family transcriptional regulator
MTQEALAKQVGVTRQTIIRIESQEQYDVAKTLCRQLAYALGVEESWLFVETLAAPPSAAPRAAGRR